MESFIAGLPKAELHVHHVGSAPAETVIELVSRHPASKVPKEAGELADYFAFRDFSHFIEAYVSVVDLIRTADDVRLLTIGIARDLARQNVRYAELTVTPYSSVRRGIPAAEFMAAIEDARIAAEAELGVVLRWCFDIPGDAGLGAAEETTRLALDVGADGLVSLGLAGREAGVSRAQFKPYFDRARAAGLHSVPHAGETSGSESVWQALRVLGAERIGHGTTAVTDEVLLRHLAEHRIPLEVCLTSNVATRVVADAEQHPIRQLVRAGVPITVNTDDPLMFGTDLNREYAVVARLLGLSEPQVADLAKTSVETSFMDPLAKRRLMTEIDVYLANWMTASRAPEEHHA